LFKRVRPFLKLHCLNWAEFDFNMPKFENIKTFLYSWGVLTNTIIGIGIFALPYAALKVGLPLALFYLAILGLVVSTIHWMFGELALKTPDYKRLVGFAGIHLGKWAQIVAVGATIFGFFGSLLAYIIIGGQFLYEFCSPFAGGSEIFYAIAYFAAGALFVYLGIDFISRFEFWCMAIFFAILAILGFGGAPLITMENLFARTGTIHDIFFPYGPILFSFWASSSIPEIEEMLGRRGNKKMLGKVIAASGITAFLTYALFILLVVGISGPNTAESALTGLRQMLGSNVASMLFFFGFITTFTSFVITGLSLKKIFAYDLKINKTLSWAIVSIVPMWLFLSGLRDFMMIFSLIGGVFLAIDGILIILMYQKIRPDRKALAWPLLLILAGGIIYELSYYIK